MLERFPTPTASSTGWKLTRLAALHVAPPAQELTAVPPLASLSPPAPALGVTASVGVHGPYRCRCGQPLFFANTQCLACDAPLGYDTVQARLLPLCAAEAPDTWRDAQAQGAARYRRCANLETAAQCNWLIALDRDELDRGDPPDARLCRACRLNRVIPDLSQEPHPLWWARIELAKRRLVAELLGLRLPVRSRVSEDPRRGLAFDMLRSQAGEPPVLTGHADGIITLNIEEADDARRETVRSAMREPYRTLLGHLRHEVGHYYWQRLVEGTSWHAPFREQFGDERADYAAALAAHHSRGPAVDWGDRHVSAYASAHPWEDWAETWAHYLHMVDALATARSLGLQPQQLRLGFVPFTPDVLLHPHDAGAASFLAMVNAWLELAGVLNELSRSMGQPDLYPFVLAGPAVTKLHLVHRVITAPLPPQSAPLLARAAAGP